MHYYIDSDNGMGSRLGDVDDGFAITALLKSGLDVIGLGSVAGNTSERLAARNNRTLTELTGFGGRLLRPLDGEIVRFLIDHEGPLTIAALGPLTNIAAALREDEMLGTRIREVVIVGANSATHGHWPPLWPHEFNLTKDKVATFSLFRSAVPLTFVPLNLARTLRASHNRLAALKSSPLTEFLQQGSRRWLRRARLLKWASSFPVWDLAAAMYLIEPALFTFEDTAAEIATNTFIRFGAGDRPVRVVTGFDDHAVWQAFSRLLE